MEVVEALPPSVFDDAEVMGGRIGSRMALPNPSHPRSPHTIRRSPRGCPPVGDLKQEPGHRWGFARNFTQLVQRWIPNDSLSNGTSSGWKRSRSLPLSSETRVAPLQVRG